MKKKHSILDKKVEAVSVNTLDNKLRIQVDGRWFVEDKDPKFMFGSPEEHAI